MIRLGLGLRERARAALRRARARRPLAPAAAYRRFCAEVEPALLAAPRVHRFAAEPVLGGPATPAAPVAVGIDAALAGDRGATTESLRSQTVAPAEILEAAPADLLARATAPWLAIVRPGDVLSPLAIERLGQAATLAPDAALISCDEDALASRGERVEPRCRPGPSPDLMLAGGLDGALLCVARERALAAAARIEGAPDVWRYDLALDLAGPDAAGHAHVPQILVHRGGHAPDAGAEAGADADAARVRVAQAHLDAWGREGARVEPAGPGRCRVRRPLTGTPEVEVIVLFRDRPELLRRSVGSVLARSSYPRLSVRLVDNGSVEPETAALLAELTADPRVRSRRDERRFNFAALNNAALADSDAEVVVFLNNDTEVLSPAWIEELLEEAQRPEVGAVAPLLLYADGSVQHAGAAIGLGGYAGHPFAGLAPDQPTPFGRAAGATRNWLAVTAACMMVQRRKLDAVGGFDETFVVGGNDVDLCLRLTAAGHRSLCVPHVRMLHDESRSRGSYVDPQDLRRSEERYGLFRTVGDPFYNPNLTHAATSCGIRAPGE